MGRVIGGIFSILAGVWLGWWMFFGAAGSYVANNPEALMGEGAELGVQMKKQRAEAQRAICQSARDRFNEAWDRSVDNSSFDGDQRKLDRLQKEVDRHCKG